MESIEQQLRALTIMVRQLQREFDNLKRSGCRQSYAYTDVSNAKYMPSGHTPPCSNFAAINGLETGREIAQCHPNTKSITPNPDSSDELFDIALMAENRRSIATPLTYRETQVLSYIADGNTNKQIAHSLGISEQTIKNHISSIFFKLHAKDRAHAVALAMRNGWLSAERKYENIVLS